MTATLTMSRQREYRLSWQRAGLRRKYRIYQTRKGVEAFAAVLRGESRAAEDPEAFACCRGYECGCRGLTNAEAWEEQYGKMPPLVSGPTLESRPVGEWS